MLAYLVSSMQSYYNVYIVGDTNTVRHAVKEPEEQNFKLSAKSAKRPIWRVNDHMVYKSKSIEI